MSSVPLQRALHGDPRRIQALRLRDLESSESDSYFVVFWFCSQLVRFQIESDSNLPPTLHAYPSFDGLTHNTGGYLTICVWGEENYENTFRFPIKVKWRSDEKEKEKV